MNFVVLTAALSSLNAGLYSTGRILRSMAMNGSAPKFTAKMTRNGVPFGGILLTGVHHAARRRAQRRRAGQAFEIVLNMSALGIIAAWGTIVLCQLKLYTLVEEGRRGAAARSGCSARPYTGYADLVFLLAVLVLMAFDAPIGSWTVATLVVIVPALIGGWYAVRGRVLSVAAGAPWVHR